MAATRYVTLTANSAPVTVDLTAEAGTTGAVARVMTDGGTTGRIYVTGDGTTPTVDGAGTSVLFGGPAYKIVALTRSAGTSTVKMVATSAAWVAVEVYPAD